MADMSPPQRLNGWSKDLDDMRRRYWRQSVGLDVPWIWWKDPDLTIRDWRQSVWDRWATPTAYTSFEQVKMYGH